MRRKGIPDEWIHSNLQILEESLRTRGEPWPYDNRDWFDMQERLWTESAERLLNSQQERLNKSLLKATTSIEKRLAEIQSDIEMSRTVCQYEESGSKHDVIQLVSVNRSINGTISANPTSFMEKLSEEAATARILVLVDPYALSDKNDAGDSGNCVNAIKALSKAAASMDKLHLYCREDAVSLKVWQQLEAAIGAKKLEVHLGDLHDRYLLAGSDQGKGKHLTDETWHGYDRWQGVVFGASLNGIAKRPTYVLKFEKTDLDDILAYIEGHTKVKTLAQVTAAREDAERRKNESASASVKPEK
jgi:hypothetical protein